MFLQPLKCPSFLLVLQGPQELQASQVYDQAVLLLCCQTHLSFLVLLPTSAVAKLPMHFTRKLLVPNKDNLIFLGACCLARVRGHLTVPYHN